MPNIDIHIMTTTTGFVAVVVRGNKRYASTAFNTITQAIEWAANTACDGGIHVTNDWEVKGA